MFFVPDFQSILTVLSILPVCTNSTHGTHADGSKYTDTIFFARFSVNFFRVVNFPQRKFWKLQDIRAHGTFL